MATPLEERQPPPWVATNTAWLNSSTPAFADEPDSGEGGRVFNFTGMTSASAAARLDRIWRVRDMEASARENGGVESTVGYPGVASTKDVGIQAQVISNPLLPVITGAEPMPEQAPVVGPEGLWPVNPASPPSPNPAAPRKEPVGPAGIWPQVPETTPGPNSGVPQPTPKPRPRPGTQGSPQPAQPQPAPASPVPSTDDQGLPLVGSLLDVLAMGQGPTLEPGMSRTLPSGITITANPDQTKTVTRVDPKTGDVYTNVIARGVLVSSAVSTVVPGTNGMSRDTTITDARGISTMRSVSNGFGKYTTWTANPDGTHSVQYPDGLIVKERSGVPIEVVQLTPDGRGGDVVGISLDGTSYEASFRPGVFGTPVSEVTTPDGSHVLVVTIPGQTNGELLSLITRPDGSRAVVYPDGTSVPIDRYNNAIGAPNYGNQFDPFTGTWRSDPYHRRGPITTNPDGTSRQEWFFLDRNGDEHSTIARFDTHNHLTMLETVDYTGLSVVEFETYDGITVPVSSGFLDSGRVKDESALVWEAAFMITGIPELGWTLGRTIGARLITRQFAAQGISRAGIDLTFGQIGARGATTFTGLTGAGNTLTRSPRVLPVTDVYAPTGAWDATIAIGQNTAAGIRTGINSVRSAATAIKQAAVSGTNLSGAYLSETSITLRTSAATIRNRISAGTAAVRTGSAPAVRSPSVAVGKYLDQQYVREALDRANLVGNSVKVGVRELPVGDAVRRLLPVNRKLLGIIQMNKTLEASLLDNPGTLLALMEQPKAIAILDDVIRGLRDGIRNAANAADDIPMSTRLTESQKAISARVEQASYKYSRERDPRQPGFDVGRIADSEYTDGFLTEMYKKWDEAQTYLNSLANDLSKSVGGKPGWRTEPKSRVRAEAKIRNDYDDDVSQLVDLAGAKITFKTVEQIYRALDDIERLGVEILRFKDRFTDPAASGYRDILMNVRAPNGMIGELRLHLESIDKASARFEHAIYKVRRDLKDFIKAPGRGGSTAEGKAIIDGLNQRSRDIFQVELAKGMPKP